MTRHSHGGFDHDHGSDGGHHHQDHQDHQDHEHDEIDLAATPVLDPSIPDSELSPAELGRRGFLRRAGLIGATAAAVGIAGSGTPVAAAGIRADDSTPDRAVPGDRAGRRGRRFQWLAGDHHIHTQYSSDAQYRVLDQVQHGSAYGLDWMVITDHGSLTHAKIGVDKVNPDIVRARDAFDDQTLVFQGLEWNIPAAEHGTVIVHPGKNEVAVLKEFENSFDGVVNKWTASTAANELHALEGLDYLAASVAKRRVDDAAFFANHPARKGLDSPHEIRGWRDRQPTIALGMEGAPGHQAAGIKKPYGPGSGRGYYDNSPSADSFAGYPRESYITYGGFDWMTSTVGGLWDSLLAEGKAWWVTANSDSHQIYLDDSVRDPNANTIDYFNAQGRYGDPVHGSQGPQATFGDFWPGYYSKTHVGAEKFTYAAVLDGLRAGRVYVDHGGLVGAVDVSVRNKGDNRPGSPLGSVVTPRRGARLELAITIQRASLPNWAQFVPELNRVDVIRGSVGGSVSDRDSFLAPDTKVVKQQDTSGTGAISFTYDLGEVTEPTYVRVRGTDGKRSAVGLRGAAIDPKGPAADVLGDADPWADLWFYTNPIWVIPKA